MRKKVFILSEQIDKSTNEVISYLKTRKTCSVDRLNYDQLKKEDSFKLLYLFNCKIDTYSFFWLRRGNFPSISSTSEQLFREYNIYRTYLHYIVENSNSLGSLEKEYNHNKLIDLEKAKECGLKIPSFFVIYDNKSAEEVLKNRQIQYITKALNDPVRFEFEREVFYGGFTSNVLREDLDSCQFKFPSLLQEKIEKEFEIRSFFVNEKFFSMAIFSQNDKQTSVDFSVKIII